MAISGLAWIGRLKNSWEGKGIIMKLLITGAFECSQEFLALLRDLDIEIVYLEREDGEIDFFPQEIDAVVCNWLFVHHDIAQFKKLKYIQLLSAGLDRVPLDYIREHGIVLHNAAGVYSIPMAEHAVCGVLQLYRQSVVFSRQKQEKRWHKIRNLKELTGKTVCIVGAGNVGSAVAAKFSAFSSAIYGVDTNTVRREYFAKIYPLDGLDEVLEISDVVIATLPLTRETRHLFDAERFSHMKEGAVFVNIARGGVVDEEALIEALSEKLFGAVLDVFDSEPLEKENRLWEMENVILTPHNSFVSENNVIRMSEVVLSNLREYMQMRLL